MAARRSLGRHPARSMLAGRSWGLVVYIRFADWQNVRDEGNPSKHSMSSGRASSNRASQPSNRRVAEHSVDAQPLGRLSRQQLDRPIPREHSRGLLVYDRLGCSLILFYLNGRALIIRTN